jgi:hypothetical protein
MNNNTMFLQKIFLQKWTLAALIVMNQLFVMSSSAIATEATPPNEDYYRQLSLRVRTKSEFILPSPAGSTSIRYLFEFGQPLYELPMIHDSHLGLEPDAKSFYRMVWDRIAFKDDSYILMNNEKIPLTCIFIDGQDNRFASPEKRSPLLPEFILKVYLVANDFSCQGPLKPGWPETGGRPENWDTYLYFEIKDPTIMLPTEAKIRYRWNEWNLILNDRGNP